MKKARLQLESMDERAVPSATNPEPPLGDEAEQSPAAPYILQISQQESIGQDLNGDEQYLTQTDDGSLWLQTVSTVDGNTTSLLLASADSAVPAGKPDRANPNYQPNPNLPSRPWIPNPTPGNPNGGRWGGSYQPSIDPVTGRPIPWDPSRDPSLRPYYPPGTQPGGFPSGGANWWLPPGWGWNGGPTPYQLPPSAPPPQGGGNPAPPVPQPVRPGGPGRPPHPGAAPTPNGNDITRDPDGSITRQDPNGGSTTWWDDGQITVIAPDGSVTNTHPDGTIHQIRPDGSGTIWFPSGGYAILNPDGSASYYPSNPTTPPILIPPRRR